jgi:hypothetical protein
MNTTSVHKSSMLKNAENFDKVLDFTRSKIG